MNKNTKIVMISMFKNESKGIRRMLESCYKHIDYYILQNNGSTDGTEKIVEEFFKDKNIPGFVYEVEEGWVSFGWNRNHLLQSCQQTDHGCDWIMKMDCDEYLEVDDDFDWSLFSENEYWDALDVPSYGGNTAYIRTWLWNANREWYIQNDTSHETIFMVTPDRNISSTDVNRTIISPKFRLYGTEDGESYITPTKYVTDALLLEEQMLRENTIFSDTYHFWYIGKSYHDALSCQTFPFDDHHLEYARRSNYYFEHYLDYSIDFSSKEILERGDEFIYYAGFLVGVNYHILRDYEKSIYILNKINDICPQRNEHWVRLTEIYLELQNYKSAKFTLDKIFEENKKNPFPHEAVFLINNDLYGDTGNYVYELRDIYDKETSRDYSPIENNKHQNKEKMDISIPKVRLIDRPELNEPPNQTPELNNNFTSPINSTQPSSFYRNPNVTYLDKFSLNTDNQFKPRLFAVDDFYDNPYELRNYILDEVEFMEDNDWYKGSRSTTQFFIPGTREKVEQIMGIKINQFEEHGMCGRFQYCTAQDPIVYHYDGQRWAGMVYLTPDAPYSTGTSLYASKTTGARDTNHPRVDESFNNGYYDSTQFELIDTVGNVFNRLVIFDAQCIHAASGYFGNTRENSRLFHLFFFD